MKLLLSIVVSVFVLATYLAVVPGAGAAEHEIEEVRLDRNGNPIDKHRFSFDDSNSDAGGDVSLIRIHNVLGYVIKISLSLDPDNSDSWHGLEVEPGEWKGYRDTGNNPLEFFLRIEGLAACMPRGQQVEACDTGCEFGVGKTRTIKLAWDEEHNCVSHY